MNPTDGITLSDLLSDSVLRVHADCHLGEAARRMSETRLSCVLVEEKTHPVGILTESDMVRLLSMRANPEVGVGMFMSTPLLTAQADMELTAAAELLRQHQIRHLPVVDAAGAIIGMVGESDIVEKLAAAAEESAAPEPTVEPETGPSHLDSGLQMVLAAGGVGTMEYEHAPKRMLWNASLCAMLGYEPTQAPVDLDAWVDLIHPEDRARVLAAIDASFYELTPLYKVECRQRRADGRWLWTVVRGRVVKREEDGTPAVTAGTVLDISDRKHGEALLQTQHRLVTALGRQTDRESLLSVLLDCALCLPGIDAGVAYGLEEDGSLNTLFQQGLPEASLAAVRQLAHDAGQTAPPLQIDTRPSHARLAYRVDMSLPSQAGLVEAGIRAMLIQPVFVNGKTAAYLLLASLQPGQLDGPTLANLALLTLQLERAMEHQIAEEQALRQRLNNQKLLQELDDYLFVLDRQGRVLECNTVVKNRLGHGQDLIGQALWSIQPPDGEEQVRQILLAPQERDSSRRGTLRLKKIDGQLVHVDFRAVDADWNGQVAILALARDITADYEAKQTLLARLELQQRLETISANLREAFFTLNIDADGRMGMSYASLGFKNLLGLEQAELQEDIGQMASIINPEDWQAVKRTIAKAQTAFDPWEVQFRAEIPGRGERWIELKALPESRQDDGRSFQGRISDITEQRTVRHALEEAALRKHTLFEQAQDGIVILNAEDKVLDANRGFADMLGYSREEVLRLQLRDWDANCPPKSSRKKSKASAALPDGSIETRLRRKDGTLIEVEMSVSSAVCEGQTLRYGVCRDISRRKAVENALRAQQALCAAMANQAEEAILLVDAETLAVVECNDAACQSLGRSRETLAGFCLTDVDWLESADWIKAQLHQRPDQDGEPFQARLRLPTGEIRTVSVNNRWLHWPEHAYLACRIRDTAEERQADRNLEAATDLLRRTQVIAEVGGWKVNLTAKTLCWTEETQRLLEHDPDLPPPSVEEAWQYFAPDSAPLARQNFQAACDHGQPFTMEAEMLTARGRSFWAQLRCAGKEKESNETFISGTLQDITERKRLENNLRTNQERLVLALRATNDGLWDWNLDTAEIYLSPSWKAMLGYAEQELDNRPSTWESLLHPDDKEATLAHMANYLAGKAPRYAAEFRMRHKDGHWVDILSRALQVRDAQNRPVPPRRMVGTHLDLTERKALLAQLERQAAFTQAVIDAEADGVAVFRLLDEAPYTRFSLWNPAMKKLTGYSLEEINHRGWLQTVYSDPATRHKALVRMERMRKGKKIPCEEWTITRKDGERRIVQIHTSRVPYGEDDSHLLTVIHDITESKRAESEQKENESSFRTIYEQSPLGISLVGLEDGRFIAANPAFCQMLGYGEKELRQMTVADVSHPEDVLPEQELGRTQSVTAPDYLLNKRHIAKNGEVVWTAVASTSIFDRSGKPLHRLLIVENLTHRLKPEEPRQELKEPEEERVRQDTSTQNSEPVHLPAQQSRFAAMGEMIGNIAHQWRQPLNTLGLILANIEDAYHYNELDSQYLNQQVQDGAKLIQKMSSTIDGFRNLFRPSKEPGPFSAGSAIGEAIALIDAALQNNNIEIERELGGDLLIFGFANEFSQVLLNLLANAKEAIESKRVADGRITVGAVREGQWIAVTVADNGGGIAEDIVDKIFEPYFSSKDGGSGIGLYMSKIIIEDNMQGHISVDNEATGAKFTLLCPAAESRESIDSPPSIPPPATAPSKPKRGKTH